MSFSLSLVKVALAGCGRLLSITNGWSLMLPNDDDRSFDSFGSEITLLMLACVLLSRLDLWVD